MPKDKLTNTIIGTFEGECADANITNNNGLDITRPVWENVFNSDEYKEAIDKGWFIGFLGHPEDPNCMDFRNACIVMTEGHIDDNGKVYGKFNLVDTPVGRTVKSFIDAGVTFGISVRGAGDIINNSVDPDTFVFRGFDLVSFPAFPESIPTFKAIAASTNLDEQAKYQKVRASVTTELPNITSAEALDLIQDQFAENSDMYQIIDDRKAELEAPEFDEIVEPLAEDRIELLERQLDGVMNVYLQEKCEADKLRLDLDVLQNTQTATSIQMSRKLHVIHRICAQQSLEVKKLEKQSDRDSRALRKANARNKVLSATNLKLKETIEKEKREVITASNKIELLENQLDSKDQKYQQKHEENLQYQTKIEASEDLMAEKDETIRLLQEKLDKTVVEASKAEKRASNLEGKVDELSKSIKASQDLIAEYQDAYASYYSQAVGVSLKDIPVTASTTVSELQQAITRNASSISRSNVFVEPQPVDIETLDDEDLDLITL